MNDSTVVIDSSQQKAPLTLFPAGSADLDAFAKDIRSQGVQNFWNGSLVPPLDSDYLQYTPNNKLLHFMSKAISMQGSDELSYEKARMRAKALYTDAMKMSSVTSADHSLHIVSSIIDEYTGQISQQEFQEIQMDLESLTNEQLLRMIDEQARLIKVTANDHMQVWTTVFCLITTAITIFTLFTTGPGAAGPAALKKTGGSALKRFIGFFSGRIGAMYATTLGKLLLVGESLGDVVITSQEIINVWNEMTDPAVRADADSWKDITRYMNDTKQPEKIVYKYIMKPSEMIGLLAIWDRGDRSVLDYRMRNLIFGKTCYFPTDMKNFQRIKFRISRIGRGVEHQLGTPSLFPAFSLALRLLSKFAARKGAPIIGPIMSGGMWIFRFKQLDEQQKY